MRRIASVFTSRRSENSKNEVITPTPNNDSSDLSRDNTVKKKPRVFDSLSRKVMHTPFPHLLPTGNANSSSSSASTDSTLLRTPDDEALSRSLSKKSWKSWLGGKKHVGVHGLRKEWELHPPDWPPMQTTNSAPQIDPVRLNIEPDDEASSLSGDTESDRHIPTQSLSNMITPKTIDQARMNFINTITNSLQPMPTSHPLLLPTGNLSFPRSSCSSRSLPMRETTRARMHKLKLLQSLDHLSRSEELSIAPLGFRSHIAAKKQLSLDTDVEKFTPQRSLCSHSQGLAKWVARPCYEDRVLVWTREDTSGEVYCTRVAGPGLGVAAIELSESLEILAGWLPEYPEEFVPPVISSPIQISSSTHVASIPDAAKPQRPQPSISSPPLINSKPGLAASMPADNSATKVATKAAIAPVKKGVHFAEDDKDDQIPLGYVLRIKKKREEKARFLREEREKRTQDEDRRRHHEERYRQEEDQRKREVEKREQESERKQDRERKKIDEEHRTRAYAEELHAARARRDAARAGQAYKPLTLAREQEQPLVRESAYSRPQYDQPASQRQSAPDLVLPHSNSPTNGSPASSRTPSVTGAFPATPVGQHNFSRPPSVYSTHTLSSSEDVRGRDGRRISKRTSMTVDYAKQATPPLPNMQPNLLPYPSLWGGIPPVPQLPMFPNVMPLYAMDMPLVPPSPPFMMGQFGNRPRSYQNPSQGQLSQSLPRQSTTSLPRNNSVEGMASRSLSATVRPNVSNHQRRSSDESVARIMPQKPLTDRRLGSQSDLRSTRSSTAPSGYSHSHSNLRQAYIPPVQTHMQPTSGTRPVSTTRRRQTVIS